jgi:hypothetical protein
LQLSKLVEKTGGARQSVEDTRGEKVFFWL